MHYVGENEMAFDVMSLGFPSILGCQAICVQSNNGLYGFHDLKAASKEAGEAKLSAFAQWVNENLEGGTLTAVFGVINRENQYQSSTAGNLEWGNVLRNFAQSLEFSGDIYGARICSHVKKGDSVYVQFDRVDDQCQVSFKRWSKMDTDKENKVKPLNQMRVVRRREEFRVEPLFGKGLVAPVFRRDPKKMMNLNRIALKQFVKFQ